jgi:carbon monoxide dehydrogenase subunit G
LACACATIQGERVIELKEKFSIPAPPDEVWPLMADAAVVAACIPGAELNELTADGAHRGKVTFKFGPTVAVFRGETRLTYDHPLKRCLIESRGIDQRGASRARARFEVVAHGTDTTEVTMEGGFEVAGPLEMFASAGGVRVARALLAEFATNIANVIAQRRASGEDAMPAPAPAASGTKILGRALLDGARSMIGKSDKGRE